MLIIIYLFALFLLIASVLLVVKPALIPDYIERHGDNTGLYVAAIAARLVLGGLLIYYAGLSRYPLAVTIIGWITVIAALLFLVIGKTRFTRMLQWIMAKVRPWVRVASAPALLLGAFLLYAFA